jgi:hypothetical protein
MQLRARPPILRGPRYRERASVFTHAEGAGDRHEQQSRRAFVEISQRR